MQEPKPSLPLLLLLRLPENLKEAQHPMLFSRDGSGTETTRYFRTSELAPSLYKKKKKESVYTLVLSSLLAMLLSFPFQEINGTKYLSSKYFCLGME